MFSNNYDYCIGVFKGKDLFNKYSDILFALLDLDNPGPVPMGTIPNGVHIRSCDDDCHSYNQDGFGAWLDRCCHDCMYDFLSNNRLHVTAVVQQHLNGVFHPGGTPGGLDTQYDSDDDQDALPLD